MQRGGPKEGARIPPAVVAIAPDRLAFSHHRRRCSERVSQAEALFAVAARHLTQFAGEWEAGRQRRQADQADRCCRPSFSHDSHLAVKEFTQRSSFAATAADSVAAWANRPLLRIRLPARRRKVVEMRAAAPALRRPLASHSPRRVIESSLQCLALDSLSST